MRVGVLGINHKSSDLQLRELVAKAAASIFSCHEKLKKQFSLVLLSTCNRTEIYFSFSDLAAAHSEILFLLRSLINTPFEHALYSYFGEDCFTHLTIVTAGIDSVILAESEIQSQVKLSYESAQIHAKLSKEIHYLFQKSFKMAKEIRTSYPYLRSQISLEAMVFQLIEHFFLDLKKLNILFIGNSKINRQIIGFFKKKQMHQLSLCTRSLSSARESALGEEVKLEDWSVLSKWHTYDLVIAGTKSLEFLVKVEDVASTYNTRLIIDLGVPRNVDPRFRIHPYIHLLNIEEIGNFMKRKEDVFLETISQIEEEARKNVQRLGGIFRQKEALTCAG